MHVVLIILTLIAAIMLVAVVLIQKSKGGGLSSAFAGGNQVLGVRHTNDFIEKTTWTLAAVIAILSILTSFTMPKPLSETQIRSSVETVPAAGQGQFSTEVPVMEVPAEAATPVEAPATEAPATEAPAETPAN